MGFARREAAVVRAREAQILNVPVTDPGCLRDIDTPEDYRSLNSGRG